MAELKTQPTNRNPRDFLNAIEPEQKRKDGLALLEMFENVTGEKASSDLAGIIMGRNEVGGKEIGCLLDSLRGSQI